MKKAFKLIATIVSVIITLLVLMKFISLLDFISFDFGVIGDIGWHISGWLLGFVGCGLNVLLYKKLFDSKISNIIFRISAVFCILVAVLDLFILYVISQI